MIERHRDTTLQALTVLERAVAGARGCVRAAKEQSMSESFWKEVAATLPREVQDEHAAGFAAMARYEPLLETLVAGAGQGLLVVGKTCRVLSHALRTLARRLDSVGRSLSLSR